MCAEKFDHKILSYCLMTNHIHLIVQVNETSLSTVMQNINFRYAKWANHQKKAVGHLFQARFHSLHVSNENYLINLCRYIHLNPVAAKMVNDPCNYKWSSHRNYIDGEAPGWLDMATITKAIEHKTQQTYLNFMSRPIEKEKWKPALYYSENGMIVIDDALINKASPLYEKKIKKKIPPNFITSTICDILSFDESELYMPFKNHRVSKIRALIANYWLKNSGMKLSEIAVVFSKAPSTLHKQILQLPNTQNKYFNSDTLKKLMRLLKGVIDF